MTLAAILAWPVLFAVLLACAYLIGPRLLGKRADGRMAWHGWIVAGPMLLLWHLLRLLSRERPCDEVAPGLWLGRRPLAHELPDAALVVDLVAELPAGAAGREYLSLPTLDATAPALSRLDELAAHPGPMLVHCAQGHGRSATLVAAILLRRGLAKTPEEAVAIVRKARPGARLNRWQRKALRACLPREEQAQ